MGINTKAVPGIQELLFDVYGGFMLQVLEKINGIVWGVPALLLIVGVGLYLSVQTGFLQLRMFPEACRLFIKNLRTKNTDENGVSPYRALCTALAATVGTGNLAGVAGAIAIGGPGAVFWMWICALFGMIIKCAEAVSAVRFRTTDKDGKYVGGPMYMITKGMGHKWRWLAACYCFFGVVAAFGAGNATQINAMMGGINSVIEAFGGAGGLWLDLVVGIIAGVLVYLLLSGGAKRIGQAAERLVPFAAILYLLLGCGVLIVCYKNIPVAFAKIIKGAFAPQALTGGMIGSVFVAIRTGASRGVFTNEAGMGTAAIAHASAKVDHPLQQGLMGVIEVFIDTILICTMTALVILCSDVPILYGVDLGVILTTSAFASVYGSWVVVPLAMILVCFAFATVLGWGLYGARCAQYLFGEHVWPYFTLIAAATVVMGAVLNTGTLWLFSETINGLMAIPNLIALFWLAPEFRKMIKDYKLFKCSLRK